MLEQSGDPSYACHARGALVTHIKGVRFPIQLHHDGGIHTAWRKSTESHADSAMQQVQGLTLEEAQGPQPVAHPAIYNLFKFTQTHT